ncbi:hypothetical protein LTR91_007516 [Friedmanniomyces endolithicus]|uniref:Large ribosomal subunit protein bL28m n=1 Tax=Friedmanniomyces endolithicus TaxID=329885 RepID=A0AAN6QVY0_9PEZI|nr:hypothetical protein LTR94_006285 [Friedmanniomyces endolithicus]KAK0781444.1 hypothetical protein LTR75_014694 [Friedmanniomyces endolithicus]KAK0799847.1 hypothetical protein LTR59_005907 [Friedmanniomyces endolithicus]KAK0820305.1 hypothetical protein LTR38_000214 [Friedmanniomyces endolithicus]KAK0828831.1 hypothetical protein LTR03_016400 [Friedmanniomyces endolithicus]
MASLFRTSIRPRTLTHYRRAFSTTQAPAISLQLEKNDPEAVADALPPYPYGPTRWYKQSSLGLYGGQMIRFGNNVGKRTKNKTRRSWHPNVLTRKLFSKALDRVVQVRVVARVLRTIDKLGGLDEYLLGEKEARIKELGESGWWLRWAIMQTPGVKARFVEERRRLGLPEDVAVDKEQDVAEAQSLTEEASELDIEEAAEETGELVGTDGAFQVEQPPGVPPLKFRVGPGKHIMLTADGWRRTRPDPDRLPNIFKGRLSKQYEERLLPELEKTFTAELARQQTELDPAQRLSEREETRMLKTMKRQWRLDCKDKATADYDEKIAKRDERKGERKLKKRAAKEAERERRAVAVVEDRDRNDSSKTLDVEATLSLTRLIAGRQTFY